MLSFLVLALYNKNPIDKSMINMAKDATLSVKINDKPFEGTDLISIIKNSGIADNQVSKIEIISGEFTFSGFYAKNYEILSEFHIASGCFSGKITADIFSGSQSLTLIEIYGKVTFDTDNKIENCPKLESLNFPDAEILSNIFSDLSSLKILKFDSLTNISNSSFAKSALLEDIQFSSLKFVPKDLLNFKIYKRISFKSLETLDTGFSGCPYLTTIELPNITRIEAESFMNCPSLTKISLNTVNYLGADSFTNCPNVVSVSFDKIKQIPNCFAGCKKLKYVSFHDAMLSSEESFKDCISLETVTLPSMRILYSSCFKGCISLKNFSIPRLGDIREECFSGCTSLIHLNLNSVTAFFGDRIFTGCINLESISLLSLLSVKKEFTGIFDGCPSLKTIYFGSIPPSTFNDKISFKYIEIVLPDQKLWENYKSQCVKDETGEYFWHDFDTKMRDPTPTPIPPTKTPTMMPTKTPTMMPTKTPTKSPSPTVIPPTKTPTMMPTFPSKSPSPTFDGGDSELVEKYKYILIGVSASMGLIILILVIVIIVLCCQKMKEQKPNGVPSLLSPLTTVDEPLTSLTFRSNNPL